MRDRFLAAWRTAAQAVFALLVAWLAGRGIRIPEQVSGLVEVALIGLGAGVWAGLLHWLESQTRPGWWAAGCRAVVRVLLLGAPSGPASYPAPLGPVPPAGVSGRYVPPGRR